MEAQTITFHSTSGVVMGIQQYSADQGMQGAPTDAWLYAPSLLDAFGSQRCLLFRNSAWWGPGVAHFTGALIAALQHQLQCNYATKDRGQAGGRRIGRYTSERKTRLMCSRIAPRVTLSRLLPPSGEG